MSEMQEQFKSYVQERLEDINELTPLAEILALEPLDNKTLPIVLLKIGGVVSAISTGFAGKENQKSFDELYSAGDFDGAYLVVKDVFLHYFVSLTIRVKDYERQLQRKLLIPFRASLSDVIYATLAAFRSKGIYEATLKKDSLYFSPMSMIEGDDLCADIYPASMLYSLNGATIYYDYDTKYRFDVAIRKPKYVLEDYEASVLIEAAKGYGILDGDKKPIDDYFYKGIINHDFNWANPNLEELKEEIEERYLNVRYNFESYNDTSDNLEDDDLDTNDVS